MSAESYRREICSLEEEIKRLSIRLKNLREQKRRAQDNLYKYMVGHNLDKVGDGKNAITLSKCAPSKPRRKIKPKKEKKADAIELFRDVGIPDPEEFYAKFESTQRTDEIAGPQSRNANSSRSKSEKDEIDDALGF